MNTNSAFFRTLTILSKNNLELESSEEKGGSACRRLSFSTLEFNPILLIVVSDIVGAGFPPLRI